MKKTIVVCVCVAVAQMGCASRPLNPDAIAVGAGLVVDGKGRDHARVRRDGAECYDIAQATDPAGKTAAGAVAGAVIGALLGAVIYRSSGLSGNSGAGYGAAAGGIGGATSGAAGGAQDYKTVFRNCMLGRGHVPLN